MNHSLCSYTTCNCINIVSAQVWRVVVVAATATCIFNFRFGLSALCAHSGERYATLIGYWF
jgi:hypothetical protein